MLLPDDAASTFADSAVLWNAADVAEKRKDAQVAREIRISVWRSTMRSRRAT